MNPERNLQYTKERYSPSDDGAVLIIVASSIVFIVFLIAIVLNSRSASLSEARLQAAADAASHAAASTLCSTRACYEDALRVAALSFQQHDLGSDVSDLTAQSFEDGPVWSGENFRITIQRGRWWEDETFRPADTLDDDSYFQPFDLLDGSEPTLGAPPYLAANAVRVVVEQPEKSFLFLRSKDTYQVSAESYAIGGNIMTVRVAPFAIPACALLEPDGEFYKDWACGIDRYFTATTRYCPDADGDGTADFDCHIVPGAYYHTILPFDIYGTMSANGTGRPATSCRPGAEIMNFLNDDNPDCSPDDLTPDTNPINQTYFPPIYREYAPSGIGGVTYPYASQFGDHFGVVGVPVNGPSPLTPVALETALLAQVRSKLATPASALFDAQIGQRFKIIRQGLTAPNDNTLIWNAIANQVDNRPLFDTELRGIYFYPRNPFYAPSFAGHGQLGTLLNGDQIKRELGFSQPVGFCNSARFEFNDTNCAYQVEDQGTYDCPRMLCPNSTAANLPRVWEVPIPVIAPLNGGPCAGEPGNDTLYDPLINPNEDHVIIGFVQMKFFDSDIGAMPPTVPAGPTNAQVNWAEEGCFKNGREIWGFSPPDAFGNRNPQPCNNVRAKIACDTELVPSAEFFQARNPEIIEQPL